MSRYYKIDIDDGAYVFTNQVNGRLDPGSLQVEWDLPASSYDTPAGQATVKICGIPLTPQGGFPGISQASDLNRKKITISGGMQKGLPLATADASQSGVLISGSIIMGYGNWMGVNQTIELVITGDGGATQDQPANIVVDWKKGTPLAQALQQTLQTAYPDLKVPTPRISSSLVLGADETHQCSTIQQLTEYINDVSKSIIQGGTYSGVFIYNNNGTLTVFDNSSPSESDVTNINFADLIGQPTWLGSVTIQFNTVMRADLTIGSTVQLPQLSGFQSITTPQSQSLARNKRAFDGTWEIVYIRHVGNSRGADAQNWITTFQAVSNTAPQDLQSVQSAS